MKEKTTFKTFEEARKYVRTLSFLNKQDWQSYTIDKGRPIDIPAHPEKMYKGKGWKNHGDWLGHYPIRSRSREYLLFGKARKLVHSLNIKTLKEWQNFNSERRIELQIPASPNTTYKKQWVSWSDWLGNDNISTKFKEYLSFEEAKKLVQPLKLRGQQEYNEYLKIKGYTQKLPCSPNRFYKDKGWISTPDFLGYKTVKRELHEEKYLYFYDLGNNILGYGITYQPHKRNIEHRMQAKKVGFKIKQLSSFKFNDGRIALKVEKHFRHKYPVNTIPIKGFATENTLMEFYHEMIKYIELKQKTDRN